MKKFLKRAATVLVVALYLEVFCSHLYRIHKAGGNPFSALLLAVFLAVVILISGVAVVKLVAPNRSDEEHISFSFIAGILLLYTTYNVFKFIKLPFAAVLPQLFLVAHFFYTAAYKPFCFELKKGSTGAYLFSLFVAGIMLFVFNYYLTLLN